LKSTETISTSTTAKLRKMISAISAR